MSTEFKRENRYIVIKHSDLDKLHPSYKGKFSLELNCISAQMPSRKCLVIESDWPEYEPAWAAIEARVTGKPVEQHQGEPVALPARRQWNGLGNAADNLKASGWNACLDAIAKIGPLYTHADAGEAERPSQIALSLQTKLKSVESERDRLRAKLAEQEHSARELLRIIGMSVQGSAAYNRAVIAFHDSLNADTKPN